MRIEIPAELKEPTIDRVLIYEDSSDNAIACPDGVDAAEWIASQRNGQGGFWIEIVARVAGETASYRDYIPAGYDRVDAEFCGEVINYLAAIVQVKHAHRNGVTETISV